MSQAWSWPARGFVPSGDRLFLPSCLTCDQLRVEALCDLCRALCQPGFQHVRGARPKQVLSSETGNSDACDLRTNEGRRDL